MASVISMDNYINCYIIRHMSLDHVLLGLLREPASGFDLKGMFDQGIGHFWAAELSQIYPTLKRLERQGWLRSHSARRSGAGGAAYTRSPPLEEGHFRPGSPAIPRLETSGSPSSPRSI